MEAPVSSTTNAAINAGTATRTGISLVAAHSTATSTATEPGPLGCTATSVTELSLSTTAPAATPTRRTTNVRRAYLRLTSLAPARGSDSSELRGCESNVSARANRTSRATQIESFLPRRSKLPRYDGLCPNPV